jgi:hypothetical protein
MGIVEVCYGLEEVWGSDGCWRFQQVRGGIERIWRFLESGEKFGKRVVCWRLWEGKFGLDGRQEGRGDGMRRNWTGVRIWRMERFVNETTQYNAVLGWVV